MGMENGQELTTQVGAGVGAGAQDAGQAAVIAPPDAAAIAGGQGVPGAQAPGAASAGAEIAQAGVSGVQKPVELTNLEEFRKFQANANRKEQDLRQEVADLRKNLQEQQRKADELAVEGMSPEEQAEYFRKENRLLREREQQQVVRQREEAVIRDYVAEAFVKLGVDIDDTALQLPSEVSWAAAADLINQASSLAVARAKVAVTQTQGQVALASREARQAALQQTGVAAVTTATSAPPGLQAEYDAKRKALINSGDTHGALKLKREYRGKGLDV